MISTKIEGKINAEFQQSGKRGHNKIASNGMPCEFEGETTKRKKGEKTRNATENDKTENECFISLERAIRLMFLDSSCWALGFSTL